MVFGRKAEARPRVVDFVATMVPMQHDTQQPLGLQNPYLLVPDLPDTKNGLPAEVQQFREQCATGVRQAVAMVTAVEAQLYWERSRREQAEEDCKVLLAAINAERTLSTETVGSVFNAAAYMHAKKGTDELTLKATELPKVSSAATTIQKHFRGMAARKEYEHHLRDILCGVDPDLDPATLPATASRHISGVNAAGPPKRLGLRAAVDGVQDPGLLSYASPQVQQSVAYLRKEVDGIERRLNSIPDAPEDPGFDVKQLLMGSYPAGSAQVIAALVRRCKQLQAGLLECGHKLQEAETANIGLKQANSQLVQLSQIRLELQVERIEKLQLQQAVAKLRSMLEAYGAQGMSPGQQQVQHNPHLGAWYRKMYGQHGTEFAAPPNTIDRRTAAGGGSGGGGGGSPWPPLPPPPIMPSTPGRQSLYGRGSGGVVFSLDGPDADVEVWDDLRPAVPDPVMIPKPTTQQYMDLMQIKADMHSSARPTTALDPLYSSPVPDTSNFSYQRDTPLMPMYSPTQLVRESGIPTDAALGLQPPQHLRAAGPHFIDPHQSAALYSAHGQASSYGEAAPLLPVYSVVPLIKENEYIRSSAGGSAGAQPQSLQHISDQHKHGRHHGGTLGTSGPSTPRAVTPGSSYT